jgi:tetratricopeptide (TPR) repeat protein
LLERGAAYVGRGNMRLAERDFDKVLKINPDNPYANYNKAAILVKSSRFGDSINFMKKALKLDEELVDIVRKDPTFKKLRNDKRFTTIIPNLE